MAESDFRELATTLGKFVGPNIVFSVAELLPCLELGPLLYVLLLFWTLGRSILSEDNDAKD